MDISLLPVECISSILAFTSPKDVCRFAAASPTFKSAADSDALWETFLPADYKDIISQSSSSAFLNSLSKKALYFHLSDRPLLISGGNSSFALEKDSGRICYMIGARDLDIIWGDSPQYWAWKSLPESRFSEVAELVCVCWLEIKGKIEARKLTPKTNYAAYLVFKFSDGRFWRYGFQQRPVLLSVCFEGAEVEEGRMALLDPPEGAPVDFQERTDGWMEVEMGEIFNELDDGSITFRLKEVDDYTSKCGLIVEGIEPANLKREENGGRDANLREKKNDTFEDCFGGERKEKENLTKSVMDICLLPVECISCILEFTSPKDVCRLAAVSPTFRSAADSDTLWKTFLPADYQEIISQPSSSAFLNSLSKKALYFHLSDDPLLIGGGNSSFALEKESGRKCYMIGARDLDIVWGKSPQYWTWDSDPESRFSEVAELRGVWWLDIKGRIEARMLTPKTNYAAYLVFKLREHSHYWGDGFHNRPVLVRVYFEGAEVEGETTVLLDPPVDSRERPDGWKEIEMGQIFNDLGDDGSIIFQLKEVDCSTIKTGLVVEGIEIRPKHY